MIQKDKLFGKTLTELTNIAKQLGLPAFTGKQLADWLYKKRIDGIEQMTNISAKGIALLKDRFELGLQAPTDVQQSADGTKKYLFPTDTGNFIEAVMIPDKDRVTLCVSSQVGCKMGCTFCMTARQGYQACLSAGEIVNQLHSIPEHEQLTNVVFMGMGEPFDNTDEVLKSLEIITADWGYAWSPKRVTVSSIGVTPGMVRFLEESKCHLAISLHNPFNEERRELMPMQKAYPIEEVVDLIRRYDFSHQRRVSFEYIMFAGVNDTPRHAEGLAKLLKGLDCRINLIRFHPIPDSNLSTSPASVIENFQQHLMNKGFITTLRASRGMDILAACGMLSTAKRKEQN